jgi:hypothetical protein
VARPAAPRAAPAAADKTVELEFWRSVNNSDDADDFKDYLKEYPKGSFSKFAKRRIRKIKR